MLYKACWVSQLFVQLTLGVAELVAAYFGGRRVLFSLFLGSQSFDSAYCRGHGVCSAYFGARRFCAAYFGARRVLFNSCLVSQSFVQLMLGLAEFGSASFGTRKGLFT